MIEKIRNILLWKKKERKEEKPAEEEEEEVPITTSEFFISERYPEKPRVIFIGSGKGGVGKSFIASSLVTIASAHSNEAIYALDADLDNSTLTLMLTPEETVKKLESIKEDYLTLAGVLTEGLRMGKNIILKYNATVTSCGGTTLNIPIRIIPTFNVNIKKRQLRMLYSVDTLLMRESTANLLRYFKERNRTLIIDAKQKSNLAINLDPLYSVAVSEADVVIIVTEPPYLTFTDIIEPYNDIKDKAIIVVNKVTPSVRDKLTLLISDARRERVPVFIVPFNKEEKTLYDRELTVPARNLGSPTARYVGAIASYLNLVERCDTKCCELYNEILEKEIKLFRKKR